MNFNVLIIGNGKLRETIRSFVPSQNGEVRLSVADSDIAAYETLNTDTQHMVVVDFESAQLNPLKLLNDLHNRGHHRDMIVVAHNPSIENAVECIRRGARDFIQLPQDSHRLKDSVEDIYSQWHRKVNSTRLHAEQRNRFNPSNIIGECRQMQNVACIIQKIVSRPWVTVLVRGETGTGKEVIARAIHYLTAKEQNKPFVEVNCTAIPETLLESELFGHKKGAFTDAKENKKGLIEMAQGGSLFLDEIGDMSVTLQSKLLKMIEEKQIRRLGSTETITVKTRIIAGTNADINQRIEDGLFRRDLYYRLNVVTIHLPPLRERGQDILLLAGYFLDKFAEDYDAPVRKLSAEAQKMLLRYPWPGNVRELQNTIERIILLGDDDEIDEKEVLAAIDTQKSLAQVQPGNGRRVIEIPDNGISLKEGEKRIIREVLKLTKGNRSNAAEILGISRPRLKRKIDEYRIK